MTNEIKTGKKNNDKTPKAKGMLYKGALMQLNVMKH